MARKNFIDYAKALCIIFVVFIHTGFSSLNNIVLFAIPVFFAATGYTFSFGKRKVTQNISQRFRTIMVPYFLFMLFYTLVEIARANLFGYGDARIAYSSLANTIYGSGITPFDGGIFDKLKLVMSYKAQPQAGVDLILPSNCHLWFLPAMFTAFVIFSLLVNVAKRNHFLKIAAILCLVLFASTEVIMPGICQLPFGLGRGAIGAAFMLFGFWIKDFKLFENKSKLYYLTTNLLSVVLFIGALSVDSDGSAFVRSYYGPHGILSVFATFIGGSAGIWLVFSICMGIEKLSFERIKKLLSYMGKNVMTVYAWHMVFKFLFDVFYIHIIKASDLSLLDEYKMGMMPENSMWFMLFEAVAVIAMCLLWSKFIHRIKPVEKTK